MKANKKFVNEDAGVSAVIGVILMVGITIAIATTVYVYTADMIQTGVEVQPNVAFMKYGSGLVVTKTEPNLDWSSVSYNITGGINASCILPEGTIKAGHAVQLVNQSGVTLRLIYENGLLGSWVFA